MTPFASVGIYANSSGTIYKGPRKERPLDLTQARKAAMRHWAKEERNNERLVRVVLAREINGMLEVSEKIPGERHWLHYDVVIQLIADDPRLMAILAELGIDQNAAPPPLPDVLVINGHTYRRDI